MNDIVKIVKTLEESVLLITVFSKTIKNEVNKQKGGFVGMLFGILNAGLFEKVLTGKGTIRAGEVTIMAGESTIRGGQYF